jgi:hypothetical protein
LEGRTRGFDIRRKSEVGPKGKLEDMAAGENRGPGSKAKLDDATPARVGGWLEGKLKDQMADEGLEVGPEGRPEEQ